MGKVWIISDTHEKHKHLSVPKDIDAVIHAGDAANSLHASINEKGFREAMDWYNNLDIPIKIYSPGNHDTAFAAHFIERSDYANIQFLVNEPTTLFGKKLYASPYTPRYGPWAYMMDDRIKYNWLGIPIDTQILVTHGPPYGIRDIASGLHAGCKHLRETVGHYLPELEYHFFGHFHDWGVDKNSGVEELNGVTYVNAAVVDLKHTPINNGIILEI